MKLKKLLRDLSQLQIKGSKEISITGLTANSKLVFPGNLFIAKKGLVHDGHQYIPEAIASGATAVLSELFDESHITKYPVHYSDVDLLTDGKRGQVMAEEEESKVEARLRDLGYL